MTQKSFLLAALAGVAFSVNAFAYSPKDSASPAAGSKPRPIVTSVVKPTGLPRSFMGSVVQVEFTLDQAGQPHDIKVLRISDPILTRQLVAAFSQWRFEQSSSSDVTPKRFVIPIELKLDV